MSVSGGPDIVENGLVLCLDAGNTKSYPGSGTVWTDLSRRGNNGTLTNGPTFNSVNGGAVIFDGSNDYGSSTISLSSSNMTVEIGFKLNSSATSWVDIATMDDGTNSIMMEFGGFNGVANTNGHLRYYGSNTTFISDATSNGLASGSQYIYDQKISVLGLTSNSSSLASYFNGIKQGTGSFGQTVTFTRLVLANDLIRTSRNCSCNIYYVKLYNRGLSDSEMRQNYNATKGRFRL